MLDAQEITHRFLDTKLQVHPEVVRYILEQNEPDLIDRIIAAVPKDTHCRLRKAHPGGQARSGTGRGSLSTPRSR